MSETREKELVERYRKAKEDYKAVSDAASLAKTEMLSLEEEIVKYMVDNQKKRTAGYEDIGSVTLNKPKVRASCVEANKPKLFDYLEEISRKDMIKTSVHVSSLSTLVKEILEEGKEPPKFISYYLQDSLTLNKK